MSDLLVNYRDPNDLGENPDGDTRTGINFVFKACAQQLQTAAKEIEAQKEMPTYPRFQLDPAETQIPVQDRIIAVSLAIGLTDQDICNQLGIGWNTMLERRSSLVNNGQIPAEIVGKRCKVRAAMGATVNVYHRER